MLAGLLDSIAPLIAGHWTHVLAPVERLARSPSVGAAFKLLAQTAGHCAAMEPSEFTALVQTVGDFVENDADINVELSAVQLL